MIPFRLISTLLLLVTCPLIHASLKIKEFKLKQSYQNEIQSDFPILQAKIESSTSFWLLGQNYLWHYDVQEDLFEKISFRSEEDFINQFPKITLTGKNAFVATDHKLFQITLKGKRDIYSYESLDRNSLTHSLQKGPNSIFYWIQGSGIQTINTKEKISSSYQSFFPTEKDILLSSNKKDIYYIEDRALLKWHLKKAKRKHLFHTNEELLSIHFNSGMIELVGEKNIFILTIDGKLIQKIPLDGHRKIIYTKITKDYDYYIFNDLLLERKNKKEKTTHFFEIPNLSSFRPEGFDINDDVLLLLIEGKPYFFRMKTL